MSSPGPAAGGKSRERYFKIAGMDCAEEVAASVSRNCRAFRASATFVSCY